MHYIVIKQGAHMQAICGIYSVQSAAMERANECARADHDSYHTYDVYAVALDVQLDVSCVDENVYSVNKKMMQARDAA